MSIEITNRPKVDETGSSQENTAVDKEKLGETPSGMNTSRDGVYTGEPVPKAPDAGFRVKTTAAEKYQEESNVEKHSIGNIFKDMEEKIGPLPEKIRKLFGMQ